MASVPLLPELAVVPSQTARPVRCDGGHAWCHEDAGQYQAAHDGVSSLILASVLMAPGMPAVASHWPSRLGGHHGKLWKKGDARHKLGLTDEQERRLAQLLR